MDAIAGAAHGPSAYEADVPLLHHLAIDSQILFRVGAMVWPKDTIYQERVLSSFEAAACLSTSALRILMQIHLKQMPLIEAALYKAETIPNTTDSFEPLSFRLRHPRFCSYPH